jgi:hypothetical protein
MEIGEGHREIGEIRESTSMATQKATDQYFSPISLISL